MYKSIIKRPKQFKRLVGMEVATFDKAVDTVRNSEDKRLK
jgi:hypothetical protein